MLINALSAGRFAAPDLATALARDLRGETLDAAPQAPTWKPVTSPSKDRFVLRELNQRGPTEGVFAAYFSAWIRSPRALDDLLSGGPDAPRFTMLCFVSQRCRLFLNGREVLPTRSEPADYRVLLTFDALPLRQGWNHFIWKVASTQLDGEAPATLAARILSNNPAFLQQLDSAAEAPNDWD